MRLARFSRPFSSSPLVSEHHVRCLRRPLGIGILRLAHQAAQIAGRLTHAAERAVGSREERRGRVVLAQRARLELIANREAEDLARCEA